MPVIFGSFETSLRGQDSPRPDRRLHKGCSGHLHGAGVKKERASRTPEFKFSKSCCHDEKSDNSSSDEGTTSRPERRSQSSEYSRMMTPVSRRSTSSNSAVAQRLFSSPTKATTAKLRAERTASDGVKMASDLKNSGLNYSTNSLPRRLKRANKSEDDSGNFSSSEENNDLNIVDLVKPSVNKQNLIHGTSDDELSIEELRKKQRQERRDYLQHRNGGSRRESPSPVKRGHTSADTQNGGRGRKSSDDSDSSFTPPASPIFRSSSNKMWSANGRNSLPKPRARSSGTGANSCPYAFGSSTKRFSNGEKSKLAKTPSDGVQSAFGLKSSPEFVLNRTMSDPKTYQRQHSREKAEIAKAWLKFKEDIESAMQKKPNSGYYKNLADMMTTKMEMLNDEVRK